LYDKDQPQQALCAGQGNSPSLRREGRPLTIRIATDSTCDLPQEIIRKYGIAVVPLYIHAGGRAYQDSVDISRWEFYQRLPSFRPAPTTAVTSPEVFRWAYEQLAAEGATEVLSIHISVKLSAMVAIALVLTVSMFLDRSVTQPNIISLIVEIVFGIILIV
jgi:DegV family protein with EDD domain